MGEKQDYLQDLYGTPELTTTEHTQKTTTLIKRNFEPKKIDLTRFRNNQ